YLAYMGIYVFQREVLMDCLQDIRQTDFGKEVIPTAIAQRKVFAYRFEGYWEDIGTIRAFYRANLELTTPHPRFNLYEPEARIYTHSSLLPDSNIRDCHIMQSLISEGCTLTGSQIQRSIIGIRSKVGRGTEIERTLVMGADFYESPGSGA